LQADNLFADLTQVYLCAPECRLLAVNVSAGTARFRQLSGAFRKTLARREPIGLRNTSRREVQAQFQIRLTIPTPYKQTREACCECEGNKLGICERRLDEVVPSYCSPDTRFKPKAKPARHRQLPVPGALGAQICSRPIFVDFLLSILRRVFRSKINLERRLGAGFMHGFFGARFLRSFKLTISCAKIERDFMRNFGARFLRGFGARFWCAHFSEKVLHGDYGANIFQSRTFFIARVHIFNLACFLLHRWQWRGQNVSRETFLSDNGQKPYKALDSVRAWGV
jgi:hypothetical protein